MSNFALKKYELIDGHQEFDLLVVDDKVQFEDFEADLLGNKQYCSELKTIVAYMEAVANNKSVPSTKFKDITPEKETVKEYEFRSKHLRIYAIKKENGKIIILGGFKKNQSKDFIKFRSLKKQYLGTLK